MQTTPPLTLIWTVSGMHCSSCGILIDEALEELDGVDTATTSLRRKTTTVSFDPARCDTEQIVATIAEVGYHAAPAEDVPEPDGRRAWFRRTPR